MVALLCKKRESLLIYFDPFQGSDSRRDHVADVPLRDSNRNQGQPDAGKQLGV